MDIEFPPRSRSSAYDEIWGIQELPKQRYRKRKKWVSLPPVMTMRQIQKLQFIATIPIAFSNIADQNADAL